MESTGWVTRPWPRWLISYTLGRATHLDKIRTRWKTGLMSKSQGPRSGPMWWHQCGPILNICAKPVPLVSHFIRIWRENIMSKLGKHVKKMEHCCKNVLKKTEKMVNKWSPGKSMSKVSCRLSDNFFLSDHIWNLLTPIKLEPTIKWEFKMISDQK